MSDEHRRSVLGDLRDDVGSLAREAAEILQLRWELMRLELAEDLARVKWLAMVLAVGAVMLVGALPVLVVAAAESLDGVWGLGRLGWLLVFGFSMIVVAVIGSYIAWVWFRRHMTALRETLAELEEDCLWLDEWRQR